MTNVMCGTDTDAAMKSTERTSPKGTPAYQPRATLWVAERHHACVLKERRILSDFVEKFQFALPDILQKTPTATPHPRQ